MLRVRIENDQQRDQHVHADGALHFGRQIHASEPCVVIDDPYVSRHQLEIQELDGAQVRLVCRGRSTVHLRDAEPLRTGQSRDVPLPVSIVVGRTSLEIESATAVADQWDVQTTLNTADFDDLRSLAIADIAAYYPYPLAFGFRMSMAISHAAELYREQLRLAENLLAFVASVSLALLEGPQFCSVSNKSPGTAAGYWRGGISPGDWLTLAIHAAEQHARNPRSPLAQGLCNLQIQKAHKGFGGLARQLIAAKNDFKHDRGPATESEYEAAAQTTGDALLQAYEFLSFLTEHPLRLVADVNPRRRGRQSDILFLNCMGDHPGLASEPTVRSQSLRKGDLYIEAEADRLVPLYPFLHAAACRQCKAREFFFVDRVDASDAVAELKSFERGHTLEDAQLGRELQQLFRVDKSADPRHPGDGPS